MSSRHSGHSNKLLAKIEYAGYIYKRNNWIVDPRWLRSDCFQEEFSLNSPVFLLGTQGGGLTLVSRMLRRNREVVSVTGNNGYWSGADEMQAVLRQILPDTMRVPDITGSRTLRAAMGWMYASDNYIDSYRSTGSDVQQEDASRILSILRWVLDRHSESPDKARFLDKSQIYTVKVAYINQVLAGQSPRFVLVTRNPYAMCLRAALGGGLGPLVESTSLEERLEIASQHWSNSIRAALKDGENVEHFLSVRFEDVLASPEETIRRICEFAELEFSIDMLPGAGQTIPFGSLYRNRWYPFRNANKKHKSKLTTDLVTIVNRHCEDLAERFGYKP